jgi:hypothetical protein
MSGEIRTPGRHWYRCEEDNELVNRKIEWKYCELDNEMSGFYEIPIIS